MTFEEVLDQALALLYRRGRVTYQTLHFQFELDNERLEALKDAFLFPTLRLQTKTAVVLSGPAIFPTPHNIPNPRRMER